MKSFLLSLVPVVIYIIKLEDDEEGLWQYLGRMAPTSVKELPKKRKRSVGGIGTPFFSTINGGDGTSIWDDRFPFGDFIDAHLSKEKDSEKVKELGLEMSLQAAQAYSVRMVFLIRCMEREFDDLEKEKKAHVREIAELQKKLSESEKNVAHMTSLKDEEVNKLKKNLEELSLEKSEWIAREEDLMEENSKIKLKLHVEQNTHNVTVDELKAEIEEMKVEIEELKVEIPLQYKPGFDKAVKQVLSSISGLKP